MFGAQVTLTPLSDNFKLQRWRGFQSFFGLKAAPVLEFVNFSLWGLSTFPAQRPTSISGWRHYFSYTKGWVLAFAGTTTLYDSANCDSKMHHRPIFSGKHSNERHERLAQRALPVQ